MLRKTVLKVLVSAVFITALVSCQSVKARDDHSQVKQTGSLAVFKGSWKSVESVYQDPQLDGAYAALAEKMPFYTSSGVKAALVDMYNSVVVQADFDGSNTVKLVVKQRDGSEKAMTVTYMYKGPMKDPSGDWSWDTYEAKNPTKEMEVVKFLAAMPPHSHNGGNPHWHARFGRYSLEFLVNGYDNWFPTYVQTSVPHNELVAKVKEGMPKRQRFLPKSPLASFNGKWVNWASLDLAIPEVQAVIGKLIKEYAGKNPKGGNFTKADIMAATQKAYPYVADFSELEFITADGTKNEIVVYKVGKEVFRGSYKRVGPTPKWQNQLTVMTDMAGAKQFTKMALTVVHGEPGHFHFWYGVNDAAVDAVPGAPSCISADNPPKVIAEVVEKRVKRALDKLIEEAQ